MSFESKHTCPVCRLRKVNPFTEECPVEGCDEGELEEPEECYCCGTPNLDLAPYRSDPPGKPGVDWMCEVCAGGWCERGMRGRASLDHVLRSIGATTNMLLKRLDEMEERLK